MSIIEDLEALQETFQNALPDTILITTDATEVRPTLEDGQIVVWLYPPEQIEYITCNIQETTWSPVIIGPTGNDPVQGIAEIEPVLQVLADLTQADQAALQTIQLGNSAPFPAAQLTFTLTTQGAN